MVIVSQLNKVEGILNSGM